jgi:NAD(P)H dehydrogenase (quinone)
LRQGQIDFEEFIMNGTAGKKALIIGATGAVGRPLVRELADNPGPDNVRAVAAVRDGKKAEEFRRQGIQTVLLDLNSVESVRAAVRAIDRIFLLTGYTVDMLRQSKAVIDAAEEFGIEHIVHLGAMAPADTDLPQFGWHRFVERYIEASNLGWTHLAPNMFMQNLLGRNSMWELLGSSGAGDLLSFFGDARIGWVDAEDIARVAATILRSPAPHSGDKYDLSVEARSVPEIASILTEVLGKPYRSAHRSPDDFLEAVLKAGMDPNYARGAHRTLGLFSKNAVVGQADVNENIETILGRKATTWREFAELHRADFSN